MATQTTVILNPAVSDLLWQITKAWDESDETEGWTPTEDQIVSLSLVCLKHLAGCDPEQSSIETLRQAMIDFGQHYKR